MYWEQHCFCISTTSASRKLRSYYHECKIAQTFITCGFRNDLYMFEFKDEFGPKGIFGPIQINVRVLESCRTCRYQFQFKDFLGSRRIFRPTECFVRVTTRQYCTHLFISISKKKLSKSRNTTFLDSLSYSQNIIWKKIIK